MHRQTPLTAGFMGYTSGGSRTLIDEIDDSTMMQQMKGSIMSGESREKVESPQNYGFTSVVMPATKGQNGEIEECAEGFMSFHGGSRGASFCGVMDDRRYRLKELVKGNVAMFDHLQHQLHFNDDGMFMTGRTDKKMKFQLGDPPQDDQQQSGKAGPATQADSGSSSGSSSSGQSAGRKLTGQKKRYDKDSKQYYQMTKDATNLVHDKTIEHKTPLHSFQPSSGAATRDGNPLVQIFGDKFTNGLGHFMQQVEAAPPIKPTHLTTKGYVDSIFAALGINIPALPQLPIPGLPPGVTLPPGILPVEIQKEASAYNSTAPKLFELMQAQIAELERRVAELESKAA